MPYNEQLANRVREIIAVTEQAVEEKKMFGGICFMVNGKMCAGVQKEGLMVRLNPDILEKVLEKDGCLPMDLGGKVMRGFVFIEERVLATKKELQYWLKLALDYNPLAKASKKKKK